MAVDDEVIVDYKTSCAIFNYSFKLDGYYFNIVQIADGKFDLKINSFFFKELKEAEEQGELNNKGDKTNEENLDEDENEEENNINNYKYDKNKKSMVIIIINKMRMKMKIMMKVEKVLLIKIIIMN